MQFKPFVDEQKHPLVTPTPDTSRRALSIKESSVLTSKDTGPTTKPLNPDASKPLLLKSISEEPQGLPVFSKPFTPVSQKEPLVRPSQTKLGSESASEVQSSQGQGQGQAFVPFVDSKTPFKVFSRPPGLGQGENGSMGGGNVFTPKPPLANSGAGAVVETFKPFVDEAAQPTVPSHTSASVRKASALQPRAIPIPPTIEETYTDESSEADLGAADEGGDHIVSGGSINNFSESDDGYAYDGGEAEPEADAAIVSSSDSQFDEDEDGQGQLAFGDGQEREDGFRDDRDPDAEEEDEEYQPLGGRFGRINVMTPITERTFEFSTRGFPTPTSTARMRDGRESGRHALEVAEKLARELQGEEEDEEDYQEPRSEADSGARYDDPAAQVDGAQEAIEERTGTLSLSDSLALVSAFRPSNPCNPFDPTIISTLLSLLPPDENFHDFRAKEGGKLDGLQRYAARQARSSGKGSGLEDDGLLITLEGRKLRVLEKLGEGGFGAVFSARDIPSKSSGDDEDEDEDLDDDDDDDDDVNSMLALKVVKPRNLWEFHVLRRIHRTLPAPLTRSIILPHALYAFRDESHLLLQLCPHGTLLDAVNHAGPAGISQQGACLDELLVFFFTIELLRFIEGMHASGYIHGDLKIDNCLIRLEDLPGGASSLSSVYQPSGEGGWKYRGIKVIDFGRTIDTSLFPAGHNQQFIADWPTDDRDCFEIREGRPWTYQTDYFGLAGIVYCMLFGKYIEASSVALSPQSTISNPVYRIATPFKRYWQIDILTRLFDMLLNPGLVRPDGKLPIFEELSSIRGEMEAWLQSNCNRSSNTLKGLLKKIELSVYTR